jgi:hypothetical protein
VERSDCLVCLELGLRSSISPAVLKSDFFRKRVLFQWKIAFTIINYRMKYLNCMSYLIF